MKTTLLSTFAALCLMSAIGFAADPPTTATAPAGGKPEWMKLTQPGDNHKKLDTLVGKFNFTMKFWMTPDAKPTEAKGTSVSKWIMNGRFVQQDVKSKMMGENYAGMGLLGYDNVRQEYTTVWLDNMGTSIMTGAGQFDTTSNVLTETGSFSCPQTGDKNRWYRSEMKTVSKNEHTYEMFHKTADGKEYKTMEIAYKRATTK